jgi:ABC-type multidrug transport system fused ATPase/permease subunit
LLKCVDVATLPDDQITARLAIATRQLGLVDRLVRSERFISRLNDRSAEAVVATLPADSISRRCAAKIAAVIPPEQMAVVVREPGVLEQLISLDDGEGKILARVATVQAGAETIIANAELFRAEIQNPRIFAIFVDLAKEFGEELLGIDWFVNEIARNFVELENIETTLTLVCHLADTALLMERGQIIKRLTRLLRSGECSVPEMTVLLSIYEKLSPQCSFTDIYGYLLQAAESLAQYSSVALRVLAHQKVPIPKTKYSVRLLAAVTAALASGNEEQGKAAGLTLVKMAKKTQYAKDIAESSLKDIMLKTLVDTKRGDIFELLLLVVKECGITVSPQVVGAGQQIVRKIGKGQADLASRIFSILDEVK